MLFVKSLLKTAARATLFVIFTHPGRIVFNLLPETPSTFCFSEPLIQMNLLDIAYLNLLRAILPK